MAGLFMPAKIKRDKPIIKKLKNALASKRVKVMSDFIKHLCLKYGKPDIASKIADIIKEDGDTYLKRRGVWQITAEQVN